MSVYRVCCCTSCCQNEQPQLKLPPYTIPCQKRQLAHESYKRRQETKLRIDELVKNASVPTRRPSLTFSERQSRRVMKLLNRGIWSPNVDGPYRRGRIRSGQFWCFRNSTDMDVDKVDTDLDSAFNDYKAHNVPVEVKEHQPSTVPRRTTRANMEGQLLKFTNLVKGYQYRWFVLNDDAGTLEYFKKKELKKLKPRGSVSLVAAKVSLSKDNTHFIVSTTSGRIFKLRARDAKERQIWAERILATAQYHTEKITKSSSQSMMNLVSLFDKDQTKTQPNARRLSQRSESFARAKHYYLQAEDFCRHLDSIILEAPFSDTGIQASEGASSLTNDYLEHVDKDLLLLKATSAATLQCINDCIGVLQLANIQLVQCSSPSSSMTTTRPSEPVLLTLNLSDKSLPNPDDEVPDQVIIEAKSSEKFEDHKSVIMHLLSQMKLGMDLTKVALPTFILEKRSLLELFTDCMAHPDLFIKIPKIGDPEGRFLAVLEWYLTSFHNGRLGTAKKPYNPILGETFHCSWRIPKSNLKDTLLIYTAEQVSHHPPVSAFYLECPQNKIKMNASIYTKSKFLGMSVGVSLVGKVHLRYEDLDEEYVFSLPSAYARSILTVPWVELGDKIQLTCEKTGYNANIIFHTKPFYGGKLHVVTAEAKNVKTGEIICKVTGEWNSMFEITYPGNNKEKKSQVSKILDVKTLKVFKKYVRPIEKQNAYESRKLWLNVTTALAAHDVPKATEYKQQLEAIQRSEEEREHLLNLEHEAKFFKNIDGVWLYKSLPDNFASEIKK